MVLHCFWLRAAASIYERSQKSHSSWEPGSWTVGAAHATSSDVARLEQPTGLLEVSKRNARHEALQLCVSVRKLVLVCEAVQSDPHLRSSALLNSKACNLFRREFGKGMWQLTKEKVEGRGPGISLLASSQASSGCLAHLCWHCLPENHRTHFSFSLICCAAGLKGWGRHDTGSVSSHMSGFIFFTCGPPLAVCSEQQCDSCQVNDTEALTIPILFTWLSFLCLNLQGKVIEGNDVSGALCIAQPWPGMARTIYGDHQRFVDAYFKAYPGKESAKGRQFALRYKHTEHFQQNFVIFLYQLDLGCLGLCVTCCKHALMVLNSVDLSSCQKGMYFFRKF